MDAPVPGIDLRDEIVRHYNVWVADMPKASPEAECLT
jgi:hypothetical protein